MACAFKMNSPRDVNTRFARDFCRHRNGLQSGPLFPGDFPHCRSIAPNSRVMFPNFPTTAPIFPTAFPKVKTVSPIFPTTFPNFSEAAPIFPMVFPNFPTTFPNFSLPNQIYNSLIHSHLFNLTRATLKSRPKTGHFP